MKIKELKAIIETLENIADCEPMVYIDGSRDGTESYAECRIEARIVRGKPALVVL